MKAVSLFSGIGGLDIGVHRAFEEAGCEVAPLLFCEKDPFCQEVLTRHWPGVRLCSDVTQLSLAGLERAEILTMGFPCQDVSEMQKNYSQYSQYSSQLSRLPRTGLFHHGWRLALEARAKIIIMENVSAFSKRGAAEVSEVCRASGYQFESMVVSASRFGAPHQRKRWLGIAWRDTDLIATGWSTRVPDRVEPPAAPTYWAKRSWPTLRANKLCGEYLKPWLARYDQGAVTTPHIETALRISHMEQQGQGDTDYIDQLQMSVPWAERLMGFPPHYTRTDDPHTEPEPVVYTWGEEWAAAQGGRLKDFSSEPRHRSCARLTALGNAVVPAWSYHMVKHVLDYTRDKAAYPHLLDMLGS